VITAIGALSAVVMLVAYALERRHPRFVLVFACGCALASVYAAGIGSALFAALEAVWAAVAARRYAVLR
jgi:hydroxyethylthiazole kinase-like sugar kinase family protein